MLDVPKLILEFSTKLSSEYFTLFKTKDELALDEKFVLTINSFPLL
jgi:hypothetical protein